MYCSQTDSPLVEWTVNAQRAIDPAYLRYQYGDSEKLRIRAETHRLYTEWPIGAGTDPFQQGLLRHLQLRPGLRLLDVGCGPGTFHNLLAAVQIVGVDASFGMVREACSAGSGLYAQTDAQLLPLPDGCVERVLANHMLFHVPDQEQALREMRRVLVPGGGVVLTTNGAEFMQRFQDLHDTAARHFGYTPDGGMGQRFTMDDLGLVRRVFPTAEREVLAGTLVFPTVQSAVRYYASGMVDRLVDVPADRRHHAQLVPFLAEQIQAVIAAEGVFRVAKSVGWFFATV